MSNGVKSVSIERQRETGQDKVLGQRLNELKSFSHAHIKLLISAGDGDPAIFQNLWNVVTGMQNLKKK
jgi:hypothetical protein